MPESQIIISPRAQKDLKGIYAYTLQTWGRKQADIYLSAIKNTFIKLLDNPHMGRHRPDVKEGYYSYLQGSHVIFYLIRNDEIDIIGVPHQRMDILNYFSTTEC